MANNICIDCIEKNHGRDYFVEGDQPDVHPDNDRNPIACAECGKEICNACGADYSFCYCDEVDQAICNRCWNENRYCECEE